MFVARRFLQVMCAACVLAGVIVASRVGAEGSRPPEPGVWRDDFESPEPRWQREYTDAALSLQAQDRSDRAAHSGQLSEHFRFESTSGSQFFVSYVTPRVAINEDVRVSVFIRCNRSGPQVFARVVLPADVDPITKAHRLSWFRGRSSTSPIAGSGLKWCG